MLRKNILIKMKNIDILAEKLKTQILSAPDSPADGAGFYVSADGDDENDGLSPESAWKTLGRVSAAALPAGSAVRFRRGDIFRGYVKTRPNVTYCAYGIGEKPRFYGWKHDLADPELWEMFDANNDIWLLREEITDCGTLVFDGGAFHSRKLIPSFRGGHFVCREDEGREFIPAREMTCDLDIFCEVTGTLTQKPSKGENFPVPSLGTDSLGRLYLRCERGNPGAVFSSIEALPRRHMFYIGSNEGVTLENLCIRYVGMHGVAAGGHVRALHVRNCEIGWIGGCIQHYLGTDPNFPQGRRGSVTRFGNGVEIYGGCEDYIVENCYIYEVYDAAITHQISTGGKSYLMSGIKYRRNLVENCTYSIEYFLDSEDGDGSIIEGCDISDNILRCAGFGWGDQRHNRETPAHIKGWDYRNTAKNFIISGNIFDRSAHKLIHTCAKEASSCPEMRGNIYIQAPGGQLGRYGIASDPRILPLESAILIDKFAEAIAISDNM